VLTPKTPAARNPYLVGLLVTAALGAGLVLAIRAMIPRDAPTLDAVAPAPESPAAPAPTTAPDAVAPGPSLSTPPTHAAPPAEPEVTPPPVEPVLAPAPVTPSPVEPTSAPPPTQATADAGEPVEPLASIRPDIDRLRARFDAIRLGADGGRLSTRDEERRAMLSVVAGGGLIRRLTAGDTVFAEQLARYRQALSDAGPLDSAARAALRGAHIAPGYAERGAAYDEVLEIAR
jgi:hypothetical protein